ncbi:3-hydroxybutyryl-CoA dehydrogenase [Cohnella xylanilytica]|nr:3-hydroxybutyryl-CoA dehydrogenase [Cohnella xylanilytica]
MGQSIAEMLAVKGLDVHLTEKTPDRLSAALQAIETSLDRQIEKWAITLAEKKLILNRIHTAPSLEHLAQCDLVIETISEDLDSKQSVFAQLDAILPQETVIASNTSTLSLTELAGATRHPERVIGMHFVYPAIRIDVVEIIRGLQTSDETFRATKDFIEQVLAKKGVMVYESPGFVTTRLICLLINEALHLLEEGVASAEDIDASMRIGYSFQHGPLEMADRFGLDSVLAALERMFREYGELKYRPSILLKKKVRAGQLGVKTGIGFFGYDKDGERVS